MAEEIQNRNGLASSLELPRPNAERNLFDRRRFLGGAALAGLTAPIMGGVGVATGALPRGDPKSDAADETVVNVRDFGARGDGRKDNTSAFQKALDHVHSRGGGIVAVPTGRYLFKGHLVVPGQTTLQGVFRAPPAFCTDKGTVLLPTEGRGKPGGKPFLTSSGSNITIRGLGIYYPANEKR